MQKYNGKTKIPSESLLRGSEHSQELQESERYIPLQNKSIESDSSEFLASQINHGVFQNSRNHLLLKISVFALAVVPVSIVIIGTLMIFNRLLADVTTRKDIIGAINGIDQGLYRPIQNVYFSKQNCSQGFEQANLGQWSKKNFAIWNGYSICFQRISASAYSKTKPSSDSSSRQCSPGVWVSSSLECPITSIEISAQSFQNSSTQSSVALDNGLFLNIQRESGKVPIIGFRLTLGNSAPCLDPSEMSTSLDFILNTVEYSECKPIGKFPNATQFESIRAKKVFVDQAWSGPMSQQPYYDSLVEQYNAFGYYLPSLQLASNENCLSYNNTQISPACKKIPKYDSWYLVSPLILVLIPIGLVTGSIFILQTVKHLYKHPQALYGIARGNRICFSFMILLVAVSTYIYIREAINFTSCSNQISPLEECMINSTARNVVGRVVATANLSKRMCNLLIVMSVSTIICLAVSYLTHFLIPKSPEKESSDQKGKEPEEKLLMTSHRIQLKM